MFLHLSQKHTVNTVGASQNPTPFSIFYKYITIRVIIRRQFSKNPPEKHQLWPYFVKYVMLYLKKRLVINFWDFEEYFFVRKFVNIVHLQQRNGFLNESGSRKFKFLKWGNRIRCVCNIVIIPLHIHQVKTSNVNASSVMAHLNLVHWLNQVTS